MVAKKATALRSVTRFFGRLAPRLSSPREVRPIKIPSQLIALVATASLIGACGGQTAVPEVRYYAISDQ
jgi:hypothetical protein